ncbi:MAG: ribosome small subunit-dependent GTPase A [Bacilli bacterium]
MPQGTIVKALSGFYYVATGDGVFECRGRGLFRKKKQSPLVGDEVTFQMEADQLGYVMEIAPRQNELVRPPIANVTMAFLVFSVKEPDFSPSLLDRFLALIAYHDIRPVIVLTKTDLLSESEKDTMHTWIAAYEKMGYQLLDVHNILITNESLSEFLEEHSDERIVLAGQSGVGKSTLLNGLDMTLELKTNEISTALGRGKHTTRHVELIPLGRNLIADTPGFSSLELPMEKEELCTCFNEMVAHSANCKFRGCTHTHEPGCDVKHRYESGEYPMTRYNNYLTFLDEIKERKPRY